MLIAAATLSCAAARIDPGQDGVASWVGVAILGVIQGLTEFLPVSSSGHLSLAGALLERTRFRVPEAGLALSVVLHLGTLVAVGAVFGRDLLALLRDALRGNPRDLLLVVLGSLPAGLVGLLLKDQFEALSDDPDVSAWCLLLTALLLVIGELARRRREAREAPSVEPQPTRKVTVRDALVVGCAQAIAIMPGVSRAGATIAAGLICGLDARSSARFSFLLGFVAIAGAALLEVPQALADESGHLGRLLLGLVLSAAVGLASLRLLLVAIGKGAFGWFALYCGAVAVTWLLVFRA